MPLCTAVQWLMWTACHQKWHFTPKDTVKKKLVVSKLLLFLHQLFSTHYNVYLFNLLGVETSHVLASLSMGFSCLVKSLYLLTSLHCCLCAEVLIFRILRILELSCFHLPISWFPSLSEWGKMCQQPTQGFCLIFEYAIWSQSAHPLFAWTSVSATAPRGRFRSHYIFDWPVIQQRMHKLFGLLQTVTTQTQTNGLETFSLRLCLLS